jgi:hypothetical protein
VVFETNFFFSMPGFGLLLKMKAVQRRDANEPGTLNDVLFQFEVTSQM